MPELERGAAIPPARDGSGPNQGSDDLDISLTRLEAILVEGQAQDSALLASVLVQDSVRAAMHAVLARLNPQQALSVLHRLSTVNVPNRRELLDALLTDGRLGSAQTLPAMLQAAHRQELLAAIFHPERMYALRRVCRTLTKEST